MIGIDYEGNELEELGQNETKFIPSHLRRECKIYNKLAGEGISCIIMRIKFV